MGNRPDNPAEFIRDLVRYAPLGALLIIREQAEEFISDAIDRGRRQSRQVDAAVNNQVSIAKSVGKNQIKRVVDEVDSRASEAPFSAVRKVSDVVVQQAQQVATDVVSELPAKGPVRSLAGAGQDAIRQAQEQMGSRLARAGRQTGSAASPGERTGEDRAPAKSAPSVGGSEHLAIADYESLSAAQINARLGGLSQSELEALSEYEGGHRARKTVLARVEQELSTRN